MKPPPSSLPPAESRKWHSRRVWDALGYFRVRSLANPGWPKNSDRVIRMLRWDGARRPGQQCDLVESAIRSAEEYKHLHRRPKESAEGFATRQEAIWDRMLSSIDQLLELRQIDHLRAVDEAKASGRS